MRVGLEMHGGFVWVLYLSEPGPRARCITSRVRLLYTIGRLGLLVLPTGLRDLAAGIIAY
jgi:hypothetical protein